MKQKKKQSKVKPTHTGKKAAVYNVDIELGKFLVIYYVELDEHEVYWRNDTIMVAAHTNEYAKAIETVDNYHSADQYGSPKANH